MIYSHIHTLQEFVTSTKALSYCIGILYLILFPAFWKFLGARDKEEEEERGLKPKIETK